MDDDLFREKQQWQSTCYEYLVVHSRGPSSLCSVCHGQGRPEPGLEKVYMFLVENIEKGA